MLKKELVEEERWVSVPRFQRALAVYQALPGPEAHELCVWFGMLARGRVGAVLAGLGFMLPGLVLMLVLAWVYVHVGLQDPAWAAVLLGLQAAVLALIVRGVHRLGRTLASRRWVVAGLAFVGALFEVPFWILLVGAALAGPLVSSRRHGLLSLVTLATAAGGVAWVLRSADGTSEATTAALAAPSVLALFVMGLKAGLLTFGGAYTAIPFVRHDAVTRGGWLSDAQFLDGLALSGVLPAPLIIFTAFVGFVGADLAGGLAMTAGVFLPAFGFTLLGHAYFERLTHHERLRDALDAVTAAVVGLIAATAVGLLRGGLTSMPAVLIFAVALALLYLWRSRAAIPAAILLGGLLGWLLLQPAGA
jgi:chromate transporter